MRSLTRRERACRYRPALTPLEDRLTPTVNSLLVAGLAPGVGGLGTISLGALVSDSHSRPVETAGLTVTYQVMDSQGQVLASGTFTDSTQVPNTSYVAFGRTIALSVPAGSTETVVISATDNDMTGGPMISTFQLYVTPRRGQSTVGFAATFSDGDTYTGTGVGRLAWIRRPNGSFHAAGQGTVHLVGGPMNDIAVNATASGKFSFGYDNQGNISLGITRGRGVLNIGTYAGDTTASGGASVAVAGQLHVTRAAGTGVITASAKGNLALTAQLNNYNNNGSYNNYNGASPNTISARAHDVALSLITDGHRNFRLGLHGRLKVWANLNTSLGSLLPV